MATNIGTIDRTVRIFVGFALIGLALGWFGPQYQSIWAWIGLIPLATGLFGWCPAYALVGVSTCKT